MFLDNIPVHNLDESDFFVAERIENCAPLNFRGSHCHNFYELLFFMETGPEESHSIDFTEHPLQSNQIFLIRPGQVHTMKLKEQKGFLFAIISNGSACISRVMPIIHSRTFSPFPITKLLPSAG